MRIRYGGTYSGDPADLPQREHMPGAVRFREPEDPAALGREAAKFALGALFPARIVFLLAGGVDDPAKGVHFLLGAILAAAAAIPHELLHALCFREEVYMYTNLRQGMLFVIGTESMTKVRFIVMSLLPNLVLGIAPLVIGLLWPPLIVLAYMGLVGIPMGAGDYLNVWNACRQVPRNGRVYLSGFHSYWYV